MGVAGALVFGLDQFFFAGLQLGRSDFAGLEAQKIELLGIGFFIHDERGFFVFQSGAASHKCGKGVAAGGQIAEGVEDGELFGGVEEGLMVVGAVDVHEPFAERGEDGEGGGRAVDELAVRAGAGEIAFEDELFVFAGFEAVFLKEAGQGGAKALDAQDGLDGATVAAVPDEGTVGALAEDEVESADDDGLAGTGLAGDDIAPGLELKREVRDQGKVFNAQRS